MPTVAAYPTRSTVYWLKQTIVPPDFSKVTASHQYEDGGMSFNVSGNPTYMWELEYDNLTEGNALDTHYATAGLANDFTFVDRLGASHTGVRYKSFDKDFKKYWSQSRKVVLVKYP